MASFVVCTSPRGSSVSNYFFGLAHEMVHRGHRVRVIIDGGRPELAQPGATPEVLVWPSPRPVTLKDARFLHRLLRRERVDCIVANFGSVNIAMLVGFAARVPVRVAWYHTLSSQMALDDSPARLVRAALFLRKSAVYRLPTHFATNSAASREDLASTYRVDAKRIEVLPLLIPDPVRPGAFPSRERRRVLCVGRLDASKGQDVLLRALPTVLASVPDAVVEFVGSGPQEGVLKSLAADLGVTESVEFSGRLPLEQVLHRMAAASVSVAPSRSEAFGLVSVEAQAVGTPVVASAVDGIVSVVEDGTSGVLVPPDDPESLGSALTRLLSNAALREQMGDAARRRFENVFSFSNLQKHVEWFERIVEA